MDLFHSRPQQTVTGFWDKFNSNFPGKVFAVLPESRHNISETHTSRKSQGQHANKSYDEACRECRRAVQCIIVECERVNQKYTDPHFNLEVDLKSNGRNYLDSLEKRNDEMYPKGVKRVTVSNPNFPLPFNTAHMRAYHANEMVI